MMFFVWPFVALFAIWAFLRITDFWNDSHVCLNGKTALVTGGNRGLGYQTALNLASRGCRVIIACRSNKEEAKNTIIQTTKNPNIVAKYVDFASLASIRKLAEELAKEEQQIHILVNNAGISDFSQELTEDGFLPIYQVNYLGHFLLTHLLFRQLKNGKARIINVSSISVLFSDLSPSTFSSTSLELDWWKALKIYGNTKTGLVLFTKVLAKNWSKHDIKCNALHPGLVNTDIFKSLHSVLPQRLINVFYMFSGYFFKSPEAGVQLILHMAMSDKHAETTGRFLWDFWMPPIPRHLHNTDLAEELYRSTLDLVQLKAVH